MNSPANADILQQAECIDADHPDRSAVESFIADVYRRRFSARLREFMPHLLAFRNDAGNLQAAIGLRCAGEGGLFVEHYLGGPAEVRLARETGYPVSRRDMVELGNFASSSPGAARAMIQVLIPLLRDAGMRWVMFVATRQLRNAFHRLGLTPQYLQVARGECLGDQAAEWGSYYEQAPELLFGDLCGVSCIRPNASACDLATGGMALVTR